MATNYPLQFVRYIYGENKEGTKDTPEKGGTPVSCAQNSKGYLYVLYSGNRHEVQVFDQQGNFRFRFGKRGNQEGLFSAYACGLSINSKDEVFIADVLKRKVLVFDRDGNYIRSFSSIQGILPSDPKQDIHPAHIAIDSKDMLYISDGSNGHVWIHDPKGMFLRHLGSPESGLFPSAGHISFNSIGHAFVLEGMANRVQACSHEGMPAAFIGESGSRAGQFLRISGLAIDSKDRIYATDIVQCVIQIFDQQGSLLGVVKEIDVNGEGQKLTAPSNIFIGHGDIIYVVEQPLHRLLVLKNT
ncbi:NHL repeat-containing protein [bacterium]|nr:NHL repeat-containing protein [bacterium]